MDKLIAVAIFIWISIGLGIGITGYTQFKKQDQTFKDLNKDFAMWMLAGNILLTFFGAVFLISKDRQCNDQYNN
jgi:hypothetical protein